MRLTSRGLRVRYPAQSTWAIDGIDCQIEPGQVTWLMGALGSGTSTLLIALAGLAPRLTGGEREGTVTADGRDPASVSPLQSAIAYLGPSPELQLSGIAASVADEIAVTPMNLGRTRDEIRASVDHAMIALGISDLATRAPGALSGGETQRLLLASLLAGNPRGWLLDEPFSALDRAGTDRVRKLLRALADDGATVVVACDDSDTMLDIADRLIVMQAGRIVLDGEPQELLAGDAIISAGAGTTDFATLAREAGLRAPRPLTRADMRTLIDSTIGPGSVPTTARREAEPLVPDPAVALPPILELRQVGFRYGEGPPVLKQVSVSVGQGEAVGLFGRNGAGKSTLLRLAMALEHPGEGTVTTLHRQTKGQHPEDLAPRAGFLFQQPERQLFASSVYSDCAMAPRLAGWSEARVRETVTMTLSELGLADTIDQHPYDLTLPRRRLVALATILAANPELLLLDEPTAALDWRSRELVIKSLQARIGNGTTVVAITHDAAFAHETLLRGLVLEDGLLVQDGPIRAVLDDHRLIRPAALAVAIELGIPPGRDRREDVARALQQR